MNRFAGAALGAVVVLVLTAGVIGLADIDDRGATPRSSTTSTTVFDLRPVLDELRREVVVANTDRAALAGRLTEITERLARLERAVAEQRASRSSSTPRPSARRYTAGVEQWRPLVARYAWDVDVALAVIRCESGGNPNARNPTSTATGLFQILGGPTDPAANIALAHRMYRARGWQPWAASRSCWAA